MCDLIDATVSFCSKEKENAMRIPDEQLEYWADEFVNRGYAAYMDLPAFLKDPTGIIERFDGAEGLRPMLAKQVEATRHLRCAANDLLCTVEELERTVAQLPRRNGHPFQPLRHATHPR